jgi:hypothetical protein
MNYFTNRNPQNKFESFSFQSGYRDASLRFIKLSEPLVQSIMDGYPNLFESDELDPNRFLFFVASQLIACSHFDELHDKIVYQRISEKRASGFLDQQKELHQLPPEQFDCVHHSYILMETDLRNVQYKNEEYRKKITEMEEKIKDYTKLISDLQDELDSVRYSGQLFS